MPELGIEQKREIFFEAATKRVTAKIWADFDLAKMDDKSLEEQESIAYLLIAYLQTDLIDSWDLVEEVCADSENTVGATTDNFGSRIRREIFQRIQREFDERAVANEFNGTFLNITQDGLDRLCVALKSEVRPDSHLQKAGHSIANTLKKVCVEGFAELARAPGKKITDKTWVIEQLIEKYLSSEFLYPYLTQTHIDEDEVAAIRDLRILILRQLKTFLLQEVANGPTQNHRLLSRACADSISKKLG